MKLKAEMDEHSIAKYWSSMSSPEHQSVSCLLKLPAMVLDKYLDHVQMRGWDGSWCNEDVLGENKSMLVSSMGRTLNHGAGEL